MAAWAAATEWVALAADAAGWGVRAAVQGGNRPRTACGHAQPAATQLPASTPATVDVAVAAAAAATAASRMEARNQVHVIAAIAAVVGAVAKHHAAPTLVGELLCDAETDCAVANFAHLMHLDPSRGPAARPQQSALPRAAAAAHLAAAVAERVRVDLLAESESVPRFTESTVGNCFSRLGVRMQGEHARPSYSQSLHHCVWQSKH